MFTEGCSRSNPGRSGAVANFLRGLTTADVVVWTGGSAPSPLGTGGAGVHAVCGGCSSSSSLSCLAGPVSSGFSAGSFVLVHGLEWCRSHLGLCRFQSALFLMDSQSALALLSNQGPSGMLGVFPTPSTSVWLWASSESPVMLDYPEMNRQIRLPKSEKHSPLPMFPAPWLRLLQRLDALAALCGVWLFLTTLSPAKFLRFSWRNWLFPVSTALNCLDFAATITAFFCPLTYAG